MKLVAHFSIKANCSFLFFFSLKRSVRILPSQLLLSYLGYLTFQKQIGKRVKETICIVRREA